jgi:hypothetical protein
VVRKLVEFVGIEERAALLDGEHALTRTVDRLQLARCERRERNASPRQGGAADADVFAVAAAHRTAAWCS